MDPQRIAAIEVGGSKCLAAIGHRATFRESYLRIPTGDPEDTIGQLLACLRQGYAEQPFAAIGVASFGPLGINPEMPDYGIIGTTPKPLWQGLDYLDALAEFGVPIAVDSDVNAAGLAEFAEGAARGCRRAVYITVGSGIGGGVIIDGRASNGLSHPELGHMRVAIHPDDPLPQGCCPFHGSCVEGLASGPAIQERWGTDLSSLPESHPGHALVAHYIAQLCMNLALTLVPDALILGGGVMQTPGLHSAVCRAFGISMADYLPLWQDEADVERLIRRPQLAPVSGLIGAGLLAAGLSTTQP